MGSFKIPAFIKYLPRLSGPGAVVSSASAKVNSGRSSAFATIKPRSRLFRFKQRQATTWIIQSRLFMVEGKLQIEGEVIAEYPFAAG